jgi:hypothetical protein
MIGFRGGPHAIPQIQLAVNRRKFIGDPILLSSPYVVQSDASPDASTHLMEVLDGPEAQSSLQISDDLMSLARESGHNGAVSSFASQRGVPKSQENAHGLLQ